MPVDTNRLEAMLAKEETALLRFTLGGAYLREKRFEEALRHLARAVELDPGYSAAWKLYGRCLVECGQKDQARTIYDRGIAVARERGDMQAAREMAIFRKRLERPD
ncbi:MAG: tetratricopeptide repeat protein [Gammaproteobacteria bacterium]|nr:tetratricopeptide repeat protein [Gammaproteobacteria bacterium]